MSRLTIAAAAGAIWLAASPVAAEPFRNFVDMCIETNLDRQAAGAVAKAAGWVVLPAEAMGFEDDGILDPAAYSNIDPARISDKAAVDQLELLLTGWGSGEVAFDFPGVRMDICAVMAGSGDVETLTARVGEHLGLPRINLDGEELWVFSREGATFRSEAALMELDESELPRIAREKKLFVVGVIAEDDMIGLLMAAVRADP